MMPFTNWNAVAAGRSRWNCRLSINTASFGGNCWPNGWYMRNSRRT